jgi:starvation-inducible outer membrane lipoprotein
MANPGTISRTNAVAVNIQAVVPVSTAVFSAAKARLGITIIKFTVNKNLAHFNFINIPSNFSLR